MVLDAQKFDRTNAETHKLDPDGSHYVQEISMLNIPGIPEVTGLHSFMLKNCPEPGMHRLFRLVGVDKSGGDIAGWRYEEVNGPNKGNDSYRNPGNPQQIPAFTVLIIND